MKKFTLKCFPQHINLNPKNIIAVLVITSAVLIGCSHTEKVLIPPRVELNAYNYIGVIEFSTNGEDNLKPYVTQNFIHNLQSAQPGTRIIELGSEAQLLRSMKSKKLDLETIKLIGKKYSVDAVIFGHLEISEIKPSVKVFTVTESLHVKAYIEALLSAKLLETGNGATLWTNATSGKTSVAKVNLMKDGPISFGISDPEEKYGKLVPQLVYVNTTDFRSQYEYRKVK
jgi:hypothetical protein